MAAEPLQAKSGQAPPGQDDRSLGELLGELMRETTTLVRQEVSLAKTEISHNIAQVGKDVAFLAAGGAVAYIGLMAIVAAVILLLVKHTSLPAWGAALLVGIVVAVVGGVLVMKGLSALKTQDIAPRQTIETLKEDGQWAKDQTK